MKPMVILGAIGLAVIFAACTPQTTPQAPPAATPIRLTSPAFAAEAEIPAAHTCDGKDLSPALTWDNPPASTKSLVILVEDPDALGRPFTHWLLYDLPPKTRQLPEGMPPQPFVAIGGGHGKNDFGRYGYGGPCPPSGTHRYVFQIFALDRFLDLPAGATKAEVLAAMEGHVLAKGEWIGKYSRKK
jgi:Raf kinase inhibitor-like YbhB/YbcL family protein